MTGKEWQKAVDEAMPAGYEIRESWEGAAIYFDGEREIAAGHTGVDPEAPGFWGKVELAMIRAKHSQVVIKVK